MDANENEIESVTITGYPTIKFYPGNKKESIVIFSSLKKKTKILKFIKLS